ncbi:MAG: glycoside hydrolase family 130 protein, partial [Proteobacteria bacterium]|nr:glycoside hydrolase family 130 protein [Pseudomonadota bacterium]
KSGSTIDSWQIGPFTPHGKTILESLPTLVFLCPVSGNNVEWAAKDVFNPGAILHDGKVFMLFRAEDRVGRYGGTSRIGLAISEDGINFEVEPKPVIFPGDDPWQAWEWPGGCEDPRVVVSPEGGYLCFYTAFDGKSGCLFVASSRDMRCWTKHGPAFASTPHVKRWSKSGSVITEIRDGRLVASRINGRYWMYWGEGICFAATSEDLIHWEPVEFDATADRYLTYKGSQQALAWDIHRVPGHRVLRPIVFPRQGRFDSLLVEPGPPGVRTENGIVLIYNGANHPEHGDKTMPPFSYQPGQILFDPGDPLACIHRTQAPFLLPGDIGVTLGQVNNVCFAQALVYFKDSWHLYYGMSDSRIGYATAPFTRN